MAKADWTKSIAGGSLTRDVMCQCMIEGIISRGSLTMMRRVRP